MDRLSSSSSVLERTECCGTTPIETVANASLKPGRHRSMQEKVWLFFFFLSNVVFRLKGISVPGGVL